MKIEYWLIMLSVWILCFVYVYPDHSKWCEGIQKQVEKNATTNTKYMGLDGKDHISTRITTDEGNRIVTLKQYEGECIEGKRSIVLYGLRFLVAPLEILFKKILFPVGEGLFDVTSKATF